MYPMRSQIWRFFQKLGAAASAATHYSTSASKQTTSSVELDKNSESIFKPIEFLSRSIARARANDQDSMYLRYSILTASCLTVAFLLIKILKQ